MIDTTTVNYALDKMEAAYKAIAPTVGQISEKYVMYAVASQVVAAATAAVGLLCGLLMVYLFVLLYKKGVSTKDDTAEGFGIVGGVIFWLVTLSLGVVFFFDAREAAVAVLNPEMYAVQHLLESLKK